MKKDPLIEDVLEEKGPDWVAAVLAPFVSQSRLERIDQILASRLTRLTVCLVNLYDPHNGAAVIRTAEAMGLSEVHAAQPASGAFKVSPKITIGCEKWMDIQRHADTQTMADRLHERGFRLWGAVVDAQVPIDEIPLDDKIALVFGNERDGLSETDVAACDGTFGLPMWGFTQSYNLSVSVGMSLMNMVPKLRARGPQGDLDAEELNRLRALWMAKSVKAARAILVRARDDEQGRPSAAETPAGPKRTDRVEGRKA